MTTRSFFHVLPLNGRLLQPHPGETKLIPNFGQWNEPPSQMGRPLGATTDLAQTCSVAVSSVAGTEMESGKMKHKHQGIYRFYSWEMRFDPRGGIRLKRG